jgi:hypothetical protein
LVYLLVFHAYINEMHGSRSKILSKKSRPYIYDVKFLVLLGAAYIYDISRLRVKLVVCLHILQEDNSAAVWEWQPLPHVWTLVCRNRVFRLQSGASGYPPNVLQPFETYFINSTLVFPLSSPEALHINWRQRPLSAKGGTMGKKCPIKFSRTVATSTVIVGLFYMPQSCDMGLTALLPLRRKIC